VSDVTEQIPRWVEFVLAGGSTIVAGLFGVAWSFGRAAYGLKNEALSDKLDNEKADRERDIRELRAKVEELQKQNQDQRVENARTEGRLKALQSSADGQDDVLRDQNGMLDKIDKKLDRRLADLEARKESKPGMAAVRAPISRLEPDSERPPPRPRLPSVRHRDGE
jgi:hypothetical protein